MILKLHLIVIRVTEYQILEYICMFEDLKGKKGYLLKIISWYIVDS